MIATLRARPKRAVRLLGVFALSVSLSGLPATGSSAAPPAGSVPQVVALYAADPAGLMFRLEDLYGVGASGAGIDFGDAPSVGPITRVFHWSDDFLVGVASVTAVRRVNEWTVPILVNSEPLGVATIWINPGTDAPELAAFDVGSALGASFGAIPSNGFLVHDEAHSAWFLVEGEGATPLVEGTSGVSVPLSLTALRAILEARGPAVASGAAADSSSGYQGALNSALILALALVIIAAALYFPARIRRLRRVDQGDSSDTNESAG